MPEALYLSKDPHTGFPIERMFGAAGYRVKMPHEERLALSWLKLRPFDVVVIDSSWRGETVRRVFHAGRELSPHAAIIVVGDVEDSGDVEAVKYRQELELRGIAVVRPEELEARLRIIVEGESVPEQLRILVVEDLDSPRDIICHFVEKFGGAAVTGVASAEEALARLTANPQEFDVVLTDMNMPTVSGSALVEQLRKHPELQKLPVIVLTAYGTPENLVRCLRAGASGFLVKPPKRAELVRELSRARRIVDGVLSPRIATYAEAEAIEQLLIELGYA